MKIQQVIAGTTLATVGEAMLLKTFRDREQTGRFLLPCKINPRRDAIPGLKLRTQYKDKLWNAEQVELDDKGKFQVTDRETIEIDGEPVVIKLELAELREEGANAAD